LDKLDPSPASTTLLFVAFAVPALVLGMIGVCGVLSFFASKRTREFSIRIALGPQRRDVLWLVKREGARFSLTGVGIRLAGAFPLTHLLSGELYGVNPLDAPAFLGAALMMTVVTLVACYVSARRAMRVDPIVALRYE
jgi:putative ABC transport system permease protein